MQKHFSVSRYSSLPEEERSSCRNVLCIYCVLCFVKMMVKSFYLPVTCYKSEPCDVKAATNPAERDLQIKRNVPNSSFWNSKRSEEDSFIENYDDDVSDNKSERLCRGQTYWRVNKTQSTSDSQKCTSGITKNVQVTGKSWFILPHWLKL